MDSIPFACTNMSDTYSKLVPYDNFTYSNDLLGCIMIENLKKTSFIGVSVSEVCCIICLFDQSLMPQY